MGSAKFTKRPVSPSDVATSLPGCAASFSCCTAFCMVSAEQRGEGCSVMLTSRISIWRQRGGVGSEVRRGGCNQGPAGRCGALQPLAALWSADCHGESDGLFACLLTCKCQLRSHAGRAAREKAGEALPREPSSPAAGRQTRQGGSWVERLPRSILTAAPGSPVIVGQTASSWMVVLVPGGADS